MIFNVNQQDLRYNARLVVGVNVVDSTGNTTYSYTIKYVHVRLIICIAMKNGL